mgnify:FL=1|tara:strand:- start:502 stop:948 length:447 start_codon:yes stop_codon:yes gene_type:complete
MFRLIFILILFFCYSCNNKKTDSIDVNLINNPNTLDNPVKSKSEGPILNFISKDHDFGLIVEGEVVMHTFKFKNTGNSPLIISEAKGSCGCTTPSWSGDPIKPGEDGYIEVKFDSDGRVGSNSKTVTITANTIPNKTYLKINANVKKL